MVNSRPRMTPNLGLISSLKLGLDVKEINRQLFVAAQLAARNIGNHFFRRRLHHEIAAVAVLDAQQLRPVFESSALTLAITRRAESPASAIRWHRHFSISARMMASSFFRTRSPIGIYV